MTAHAAEKPRGTYSYRFDDELHPQKATQTTYHCTVPDCGEVITEDVKTRCFRKAREHREAHRTALTSGDASQTTIFDLLEETS